MRGRNTDRPQKGDIIKFQNGMIGEAIKVNGDGPYATVESMVKGVRTYANLGDVEVVYILERIVTALDKPSD